MSQDFDCFSAEDFKEGLGPLGKLDDTMMRYKHKLGIAGKVREGQ